MMYMRGIMNRIAIRQSAAAAEIFLKRPSVRFVK